MLQKDIIIVGAGAAGIGMGIVLKKMGLNFQILEQAKVGESFRKWPSGTRFISPSFTGNFFGSPDLNAICPDTSPAYLLETQHPSGEQYAGYLESLAEFYELPITEKTKVKSITKKDQIFIIQTNKEDYQAKAVIWAGGEYQYPKTKVCEGADLAIHNTKVDSWEGLHGDTFAILGGYESGFDTAVQLAKLQKKSVIFDSFNHLAEEKSDASYALSPYTKDRYRQYQEYITIKPNTRIQKIQQQVSIFKLTSEGNEEFEFTTQPILATGFVNSLKQVKEFFDFTEGSPELTDSDESTKIENFFLIGPQVKHDQVIFCFIYKFRQRFAVVAKAIAERLQIGDKQAVEQVIADYRKKNFYLDDLSCCGDECVC